jgi:hypothetical protein
VRLFILTTALLLLPATAAADEPPPPRVRLAVSGDLAVGRSWLFGVAIDEFSIRAGAGMNVRINDTTSFELIGAPSLGWGRTEAGRSLQRIGLGVTAVFHLGILRLGLGGDVGSLGIKTAQSSPDRAVYGEGRLMVGVEPFALGSLRPYADLQLRTRGWAETELMTGVALALGVRY